MSRTMLVFSVIGVAGLSAVLGMALVLAGLSGELATALALIPTTIFAGILAQRREQQQQQQHGTDQQPPEAGR